MTEPTIDEQIERLTNMKDYMARHGLLIYAEILNDELEILQKFKSLDAQPVPVEPDVEALVETLRGFGRAYPEDIFGPVTQQETKEHGNLITRNSAAMGRHCAQFMVKAADMIDFLQSALKLAQGLAEVPKIRLIADQADVNRPAPSAPQSSQPDTVAVPREQLEHWAEYWNGNANEKSMTDALEHILGEIDFVLQAAQEAK